MKILERYASAICSSNLLSEERTTYSDSDVIGAAGFAAHSHPLAMALQRLFAGDDRAAAAIVEILSQMAWAKAHALRVKLKRTEADDLAMAVLAWYREGVCKPCGGHGYAVIPGTLTIGEHECGACRGAGRVDFDGQFSTARRELARWLLAEVDSEQSKAGPAAMAALAPRLDI